MPASILQVALLIPMAIRAAIMVSMVGANEQISTALTLLGRIRHREVTHLQHMQMLMELMHLKLAAFAVEELSNARRSAQQRTLTGSMRFLDVITGMEKVARASALVTAHQ